jgi:long-subunit acyl-CoA synthetase (AMP-forming)
MCWCYRGYYNNREATQEAFTSDGWLKMGDIGYMNRKGLYWVTGLFQNPP